MKNTNPLSQHGLFSGASDHLKKMKTSLLTLTALTIATTAPAAITSGIINGDFSNDGLSSGFQGGIADWTQDGNTFLEMRNADLSAGGDDAAAGLDAVGANIYQEFGLHDATNELFEISIQVGLTASRTGSTDDLVLQLFSGATGQVTDGSALSGSLLDSVTVSALSTNGTAVTGAGTFSGIQLSTGAGAFSGQGLYLVIAETNRVGNAQLMVDNVSLAAIPEVSSYALLAGLLALGSVMIRRRR